MRLVLATLAFAMLSACGGPPGEQGPQGKEGPRGPAGPAGAPAASSGITCEPGKFFCDGSEIWLCTKSGHDASFSGDCPDGKTCTGEGVCQ